MVTAAAPRVPPPLLEQLAPGGRLLLPEGGRATQRLVLYDKTEDGRIVRREDREVAFVPLLGRHGWAPEGGQ
jgi:protein-L-isoaspartate(D-aspartate) O-methyltransferase